MVCTLFIERRDGMGSVADYVIKYVPIAADLEHKCFNQFSRKGHTESVILLH